MDNITTTDDDGVKRWAVWLTREEMQGALRGLDFATTDYEACERVQCRIEEILEGDRE